MRVRCWRLDSGEWTFFATQPGHNHAASEDPAAHVVHRKRKAEVMQEVETSVLEGQRTKDVLDALLQSDGGACYSRRDIYNDRAKIKRQMKRVGSGDVVDPRLEDVGGAGLQGFFGAQEVPRMGGEMRDPLLRLGFSRIMMLPMP